MTAVPGPPADVKASSINSDTVLVSWRQPERSEGRKLWRWCLRYLQNMMFKIFAKYEANFRPNGEILSYTLYKQNDRVSFSKWLVGDIWYFEWYLSVLHNHQSSLYSMSWLSLPLTPSWLLLRWWQRWRFLAARVSSHSRVWCTVWPSTSFTTSFTTSWGIPQS